MNKLFRIAFLVLLFTGFPTLIYPLNTIEIRTAAFFPFSKNFRDIYGDVGIDVQVEASTTICGCWEIWDNLDYFYKHGELHGCGSSHVNILNFSFGIKSVYCLSPCVDIYAGIGPSLGGIWVKNNVDCCDACETKSDEDSKFIIGGVLKSGINFYFCDRLFLDLFIDYLYQPVHFHRNVDIGGLKPGIGLGVLF